MHKNLFVQCHLIANCLIFAQSVFSFDWRFKIDYEMKTDFEFLLNANNHVSCVPFVLMKFSRSLCQFHDHDSLTEWKLSCQNMKNITFNEIWFISMWNICFFSNWWSRDDANNAIKLIQENCANQFKCDRRIFFLFFFVWNSLVCRQWIWEEVIGWHLYTICLSVFEQMPFRREIIWFRLNEFKRLFNANDWSLW